MPEAPQIKLRPHPARTPGDDRPAWSPAEIPYAELAVTTNFTFLTGGSHPEEYVQQAARLGHHALAIADTHTLAGVVRAHVAAKEQGLPLVIGARIQAMANAEGVMSDAGCPVSDSTAISDSPPPGSFSLLLYATSLASYGRLCQLLTLGKRRAPKGACRLTVHEVLAHQDGLLAVVLPPAALDEGFLDLLRGLKSVFRDDRLSLAASLRYTQEDRQRLAQVARAGRHVVVPLVAVNEVLYHAPERQPLQDVITCVREGCTLAEAGFRLQQNAERHLKPPQEMARLFAEHPRAIARSVEIARRAAAFSLEELKYQYPSEVVPAGKTAMQHLAGLAWAGGAERYPEGLPGKVRAQIEHELHLIDELQYAHYFLTVHDLVVFARAQGILCQGRGAAANSAVCYCLGVTSVDPSRIDVLFERFVSRERNEPPDIDIDFEHERREEVIQYIYRKYGRDRAALTAEAITYRSRSAVREVGKALGLSLDAVDRLAKHVDHWGRAGLEARELKALGFNVDDATMRRLVQLSGELLGFPRHRSQHVGGFVITQTPLCQLVPIENAAMPDRTIIEWDKDDIDALGMLKVDVLGLGMLTCIRKCVALLRSRHEESRPRANDAAGPAPGFLGASDASCLAAIPPEDPAVYDMICAADTVGVFQIESRAQMSMLPRLRPRCYYDLVIEVAIVRPGPIQGDMVHPYLRRRNGEEPVTYPDEAVRAILGKTLGVPLFQEQAMALAMRCAGFTGGEADQLRRAIAAWKSKEKVILQFGRRLIEGMAARGYDRGFAERVFRQIQGFSEYGFPESHAASFALLVYVSAWLKHYHPAAFAAALINSQPMGFYAPAQIVRDAARHGVEVRPVDVNRSRWDCTLEDSAERSTGGCGPSLRLGLRLVKGLREAEAARIVEAVQRRGGFDSLEDLWRASGVRVATLRSLAEADAFASMGLDRQHALWRILRLREEASPLLDTATTGPSLPVASSLPMVPPLRKVLQDYASVGLSLKAHPMSFARAGLDRLGVTPAAALRDETAWPDGKGISVAGMVLVRQRPGTAGGVLFMTLEDETGNVNLIVRPQTYARFRPVARAATVLLARGRVQRQGQVIHVMVSALRDLSPRLAGLLAPSRDFR